jgi:hypothetical protein
MLENPTATDPTLALTRDILNRIEFGKPRLDEHDNRDASGGQRLKAVVPILLDARQIGTAKIDIWVLTSDARDADSRDKIRRRGYAIVRPRGSEQIEWAVDVARERMNAICPSITLKQILAAARSQINLES